ncbi:MAG: YdcH family protein [Alphaproteobacteria bacterium]|nr:YdcH family protein [Alphaproteobacteria bacterium]MCB9929245.1 YdcH family protein [Alphaproteobacteria bacterium]
MADDTGISKPDQKLEMLRAEHRDLDYAIATLTEHAPYDQVQVQRLKKRKLSLRDEIERIEGFARPDLIA